MGLNDHSGEVNQPRVREWHFASHVTYQPITLDEALVRDAYSLRRFWLQHEYAGDTQRFRPVLYRSRHRAMIQAISRIDTLSTLL